MQEVTPQDLELISGGGEYSCHKDDPPPSPLPEWHCYIPGWVLCSI